MDILATIIELLRFLQNGRTSIICKAPTVDIYKKYKNNDPFFKIKNRTKSKAVIVTEMSITLNKQDYY